MGIAPSGEALSIGLTPHRCLSRQGGILRLTLTLAPFPLDFTSQRCGEHLQVLRRLPKKASSCSTDAVEQKLQPQLGHEDAHAVSSFGMTQLVIFTGYYVLSCGTWLAGLVIFWTALTILPPSLLGIAPGTWSGWDQRSCQKERPILGNWGHGSSNPCVSTQS